MRLVLFTLIALTLTAAMEASAQQNVAYGIAIGEPLNMPECPRIDVGVGSITYGLGKGPCLENIFPKAKVPLDLSTSVLIAFPPADAPEHSSSRKVVAQLTDERVSALVVSTAGAATQSLIYDALIAKYGKPTSSMRIPMQNAMGVKVESIAASWDLGEALEVSFHGVANSWTTGELVIGTRPGLADRRARLIKALQSTGRPL
jgi:hypothetical protein